MGNIFNLHPDVFYIYEPLNTLRRDINTNEWRALEKPSNDAYRQHFTTLLLGHVVRKRGVGYKLSRVALGTRMSLPGQDRSTHGIIDQHC